MSDKVKPHGEDSQLKTDNHSYEFWLEQIKLAGGCSIAIAEEMTEDLVLKDMLHSDLAIRFRPMYGDFDVVYQAFLDNIDATMCANAWYHEPVSNPDEILPMVQEVNKRYCEYLANKHMGGEDVGQAKDSKKLFGSSDELVAQAVMLTGQPEESWQVAIMTIFGNVELHVPTLSQYGLGALQKTAYRTGALDRRFKLVRVNNSWLNVVVADTEKDKDLDKFNRDYWRMDKATTKLELVALFDAVQAMLEEFEAKQKEKADSIEALVCAGGRGSADCSNTGASSEASSGAGEDTKSAASETTSEAETIRGRLLNKAREMVDGHRQEDYGSPVDNFTVVADLWSSYLQGRPANLSAEDVAIMLLLLKVGRVCTGAGTEDTYIDMAGYAGIAGECFLAKEKNEP